MIKSKIIEFSLTLGNIPDSLLSKKVMSVADGFIELLNTLVLHIKEHTDFSPSKIYISKLLQTDVCDDMESDLNTFIKKILVDIQKNDKLKINYIVCFYKTIESSQIYDVESGQITENSINDALNEFPLFDYKLLLIPFLTISYIMRYSTELKSLCEKINDLYLLSRSFYEDYILDKFEALFDKMPTPGILYESNVGNDILYTHVFILNSINKNEALKDTKFKENLIKKSDNLIEMICTVLEKNRVLDKLKSMEGIEQSDKLYYSIMEIKNKIQEKMGTGDVSDNDLVCLAESLIETFRYSPEKTSPTLVVMVQVIMNFVNDSKNKGAKFNEHQERLFETLRRVFGKIELNDQNGNIGPVAKQIYKMLKSETKISSKVISKSK